jgi:hypothetical protein
MAAPLRTEYLGVAVANPVTGNLERSGITQYELLRDKRKASLHAQVQLALATAGVILDDRVARGFDGKIPFPAECSFDIVTTPKKRISRRSKEFVVSGEPPLCRSLRKKSPPQEAPLADSTPDLATRSTAE